MQTTRLDLRGAKSNLFASRRRRVLADLRDINRNPSFRYAVAPLEDDMFEWHVNIRGPKPFTDVLFHVILHFPPLYPVHPPQVRIASRFIHPNVYRNFVCLDMLKLHGNKKYRGWSPAYTVRAVLEQLVSFLFEDKAIPQDNGESVRVYHSEARVKLMKDGARKYCCRGCGHRGSEEKGYFPTLPPLPSEDSLPYWYRKDAFPNLFGDPKGHKIRGSGRVLLTSQRNLPITNGLGFLPEVLPPNISRIFLSYCGELEQIKLSKVSREFRELLEVMGSMPCINFRCYVTKSSPLDKLTVKSSKEMDDDEEDGYVLKEEELLGIGINVSYYSRSNKDRTRSIREVRSCWDVLSYEAFTTLNVRKSVWNETFDEFIFLYGYPRHGERIWELQERKIMQIMQTPSFTARQLRHFITCMMSSMVVQFCMSESKFTDRSASEKALGGYSSLVHLLLAASQRYPSLIVDTQREVGLFKKHLKNRSKRHTPNLGEFLASMVLATPQQWKESWEAIFDEFLVRQQLWVKLKEPKFPYSYLKHIPTDKILKRSFQASAVGARVLMFHSAFLRATARPNPHDPSITGSLKWYNVRKGCLPATHITPIQERLKRICLVKDWKGMIMAMGGSYEGHEIFTARILKAWNQSLARRYHSGKPSRKNTVEVKGHISFGETPILPMLPQQDMKMDICEDRPRDRHRDRSPSTARYNLSIYRRSRTRHNRKTRSPHRHRHKRRGGRRRSPSQSSSDETSSSSSSSDSHRNHRSRSRSRRRQRSGWDSRCGRIL